MPLVYVRQEVPAPPVLSNLDPIPEDLGIAGAEVALRDNITTGRFLGQDWSLEIVHVEEGGDFAGAVREALALSPYVVLDAPAEQVLAAADLPEAQGAILFNTAARERALRDGDCRANVLHTIASRDMLTDALMQVLVWKRLTDIVLVRGVHPGDTAYTEALKRSATKFGLKIGAEKEWAFDADMRRSAPTEVPLFTQGFGDYDILLVADEAGDFGEYILYNTWLPRPVAGTAGMRPDDWTPVLEQWAAVQLQNRFEDARERTMRAQDFAAWLAVRALGEAVTRTGSADPATLRSFLLSDEFRLDGFKGRALSFRPWNGQLRQPIAVAHPRALVTLTPVEGFLHQTTELDTLGLDAPESACRAFD